MSAKKAVEIIIWLVLLDLTIIVLGMAQIVTEGRTGYWNNFFRPQAVVILRIAGYK